MGMLFDEHMVIDAQKYALNAKASIQRNGRLGFTGEAAKLLGLQEGLSMLSYGNFAESRKQNKSKKERVSKTENGFFSRHRTVVLEKVKESAVSVLPIVAIVVILCLSISPLNTDLLLCFLVGALLLTVGMGFFSLGADTAMSQIGNRIGTALTKTKNLPLILAVSFALGVAVTVAEPDLQVLAAVKNRTEHNYNIFRIPCQRRLGGKRLTQNGWLLFPQLFIRDYLKLRQ